MIVVAARIERGFEFELENRPGTLRDMTRSLANAEVNITGICGVGGRRGILLADDADAARRALEDAGVTARERRFAVVDVPHRPGELNRRLERLAEEGLNLEGLCPLAEGARIAFALEDAERAAELLEGIPAGR